jgi:hypothetical protein
MSNSEVIMIVGGILAAVLGGIELSRTNLQSLTAWGVVVLGVVFVLLALV